MSQNRRAGGAEAGHGLKQRVGKTGQKPAEHKGQRAEHAEHDP